VTDVNGNYSFVGLGPGTYSVAEVLQPGWTQTFPETVHLVTLETDQVVDGFNFGNHRGEQTGEIHGTKWKDLNGDGQWNTAESGLAGWTIFLDYDGDGQPGPDEPSTVTDADGNYSFTGLAAGTYNVVEVAQTGWVQTFPSGTHVITVQSGQSAKGVNFGNQPASGEIHGKKWLDANGNGKQDDNEPGLPGWTIYVDQNGNGQLDANEPSTVTDANGNYSFTGLNAGTYTVAEVLQVGWQQTHPVGQQYFKLEDLPASQTYSFGEQFTTTGTHGAVATAELTDFVDENGTSTSDGSATVVNDGDAGSSGQELLISNVNLKFDFGGPIDGLTLQFNDGGGIVNLMVNEDQRVVQDFSELNGQSVGGALVTVTDLGNNVGRLAIDGTINSFAVGGQELVIDLLCIPHPGVHVVTVYSGQTVEHRDFGNRPDSGEIHGRKWLDANGNGKQDDNEPGLAGWTIYVDQNGNGQLDPGEPSTVTDSNGDYSFTGLGSGTYTVAEVLQTGWRQTYPVSRDYFELEDLPAGKIFNFGELFSTTSTYGDVATVKVTEFVNSDGTSTSDGTAQVANTGLAGSSGQELFISKANLEFNFGGPIGGLTFQFHESEGTVNLTVNGDRKTVEDLADLNGLTVGGTLVTVATTSNFGIVAIQGTVNSFAVGGQALTIDLLCIVEPGVHVVTVTSGQTVRGLNFGNQRDSGDITGTKYEDLNGNGVRDPGEPGISGVQIYVDENDDGVLNVDQNGDPTEPVTVTMEDDPNTRADESGMYLLFGLPAGQHVVREVVPVGYFQTEPVVLYTRPPEATSYDPANTITTGQFELVTGNIEVNFELPVFQRPNDDGDLQTVVAGGHVVDLVAGQLVAGRNFGNFHGGETIPSKACHREPMSCAKWCRTTTSRVIPRTRSTR
jgi:hypothetical protein